MLRCNEELSRVNSIKTGVPQVSILAPTRYNIYTADIPHTSNTSLAIFADYTGVISSNLDINLATKYLQEHQY